MPEEDDQYMARETSAHDNIGPVFASFARAQMAVQDESNALYLERLKAIGAMDNIPLSAKLAVLDGADPLEMGIELPALMAANIEPYGIESGDIKMTIDVSASQSHSTSVDSQTDVGTEVSAGGIFVQAKVTMNASVAVADDRKRESDYRSSVEANMKLGVRPTPEGVVRCLDNMGKFFDKALEIKMKRVENELVAADMEQDSLPASAPASEPNDSE